MPNYDRLYTLDEPVPYKSILIHPVKVRDHDIFYRCISCLTLEKKSIPDIRIIKMSYLEYLYHLHIENKEIDYLLLLDYLLKLCIKDDTMGINYYFDNTNKPVFEIGKKVLDANKETISDEHGIKLSDKEIFNANDFEEIRMIICNQNLVELVDETIQKDVRDRMEEARMTRARSSGNKPASFEDTMLCLVASTNISLEQVYDLTLRKFIKLLQRVDALIHYKIYMGAAMSGMVEFKDKSITRHWMSDLEKENKNDDVLLGFDQIADKVSNKT
jgi:hypothetical protein